MKFRWKNNKDIGHYTCTLYNEINGVDIPLQRISFTDYTAKHNKNEDKKYNFSRRYAYKIEYLDENTENKNFYLDIDDYFDNHYDKYGSKVFGYQGECEYSIRDVKNWCENFLASMYIIDYDKELEKLYERKSMSDWFIKNGYDGKVNTEE